VDAVVIVDSSPAASRLRAAFGASPTTTACTAGLYDNTECGSPVSGQQCVAVLGGIHGPDDLRQSGRAPVSRPKLVSSLVLASDETQAVPHHRRRGRLTRDRSVCPRRRFRRMPTVHRWPPRRPEHATVVFLRPSTAARGRPRWTHASGRSKFPSADRLTELRGPCTTV